MRKYSINLLSEKKGDWADKFLFFLLHYFRYVVVITQIFVIGVFFARFRLDQEIVDLKESFIQKQEILKITFPLVKEAQALEARTKQISILLTSQEAFARDFSFIIGNVPKNTYITGFEQSENTIKITGFTTQLLDIKMYHAKLAQNKLLGTVVIDSVSGYELTGFDFVISIVKQSQLKHKNNGKK